MRFDEYLLIYCYIAIFPLITSNYNCKKRSHHSTFGKEKETFKRVKSQSMLFLWLIFPISKYTRIKIMLARLLSVKLQTQYVAEHDANIKLFIGIPYLPTSQNF